MLVNAMNSNEEQLGLNKYQKRRLINPTPPEKSINNDTSAEIPQIDPTEDDFFQDSGQDTETSEVLSDYDFRVFNMDEDQTVDAMKTVTDNNGG
ncbi:hypothetical protein HMPREF1544_06386 [Mucor circinelloides 1006PhL]|uniref:Uncharacterized protein n=1 Tax=Mucor circinelloides f. circinelloides (strain 1006PhL) TaxID=1220926 RepID=S2J9P0_MUCC1|nr:hypothetical protein HMPREF1544_06386 [Mucor circinelloides 1006PhL]